MAIPTPAQNPRGVARITFTGFSSSRDSDPDRVILPAVAFPTNRSPRKRTTPPESGGVAVCRGRPGRLLEFDLGDLDRLLVSILADCASDLTFLGLVADFLVVLLAAIGVEPVHHFLVAFLHLDDGVALVGELQVRSEERRV